MLRSTLHPLRASAQSSQLFKSQFRASFPRTIRNAHIHTPPLRPNPAPKTSSISPLTISFNPNICFFSSHTFTRPSSKPQTPINALLTRLRTAFRRFHTSLLRRNAEAAGKAKEESQGLGARMRKLSREYLGTDRIGKWEHIIVSNVKKVIPDSVKQTWNEWRASMKQAEIKETGHTKVNEHVEMVGWGVEEAEEKNKKDASLATQLALAYAIHKSFIFIRVPLTAAWQYIANEGNIPELYIHHCKDVANALAANGCIHGDCPDISRFNDHLRYYKDNDWDGLGDPHKERERLLRLKVEKLDELKNDPPLPPLMWKPKNPTGADRPNKQNKATVTLSLGKLLNFTSIDELSGQNNATVTFPLWQLLNATDIDELNEQNNVTLSLGKLLNSTNIELDERNNTTLTLSLGKLLNSTNIRLNEQNNTTLSLGPLLTSTNLNELNQQNTTTVVLQRGESLNSSTDGLQGGLKPLFDSIDRSNQSWAIAPIVISLNYESLLLGPPDHKSRRLSPTIVRRAGESQNKERQTLSRESQATFYQSLACLLNDSFFQSTVQDPVARILSILQFVLFRSVSISQERENNTRISNDNQRPRQLESTKFKKLRICSNS
ncbi:hypothetical protein B7494_g6976 [Chlorociboria aeruginascens]|nr:hypothetical protein B7494_g6976 [Chlorociboria aeruginascens]